MPLIVPIKPDPIIQNTLTGKIADHQPYIFDVCHMGQLMCNRGKGCLLYTSDAADEE